MLTPDWRRASLCQSGECLEVALRAGVVLVRDSALGEGSPVLMFTPQQWLAFTGRIST